MNTLNKWNTLLIPLIIILTGIWVSGCQSACNSSSNPTIENSEQPSMHIKDTQLHGPDKTFVVEVQMIGKDDQPKLESYILQVACIVQKTDGGDAPPLQIEYQVNGNHKSESKIQESLNAFSANTKLGDEKAVLHVPFTLKPSEHVIELKLAIKLLDEQDNTVQATAVSWVAQPPTLLEPNNKKPQGEQSQKMQEVKEKTKQNNKKPQGEQPQKMKGIKEKPKQTNNKPQGEQPQKVQEVKEKPKQTNNKPQSEQPQKVQEVKEEAKQTNNKPQDEQPQKMQEAKQEAEETSSTKVTEALSTQAAKEETNQGAQESSITNATEGLSMQEEEKSTTLHTLQASIKPGSNQFKHRIVVENQGDKVSQEILNAVKLGYVIQDTDNPNGVRIKRGNIDDLQGTGLADILHTGLKAGQAKEFEVVLVPGEATYVSVLFFLEQEGQKKDIGPFSWTKEETQERPSPKVPEEITTQEEEKSTTLHTLQASIKPGSNQFKHRIVVENQGDKVSQEILNAVKLGYVIQDTDNPDGVRIKRGNIDDLQGTGLADILHTGLKAGQAKEFEVVLVPGEATHVSVLFFLEQGEHKQAIGSWSWTKKEKTGKQKKEEKAMGCWKDIKATIEPDHASPKKFTITLEAKGETISMTDIKLTYKLTGKGDLTGAKVKRGKVSNVNQEPVSSFFKSILQQGDTQKAQFVLEPGKATEVTIQFELEKDGKIITIGHYTWARK